ncbi:TRAP transporter substrate-binding protein DctP [Vibrio sonorensis]|uniref:TRAP transporter substrate-binding protein DctP n=1 Tax=Vibrio sonorensis TaxID=1004316 RepID=UPI0008D907D9|nr:TRAP transporter substrate-binding protein DctP [Vibrio sonorensis]
MPNVKTLLSLSVVLATAMGVAAPTCANTKLVVQTSTQSGGFSFQYLKDHWVDELEKRSNGRLSIQLMPIKSVMPRNEPPEGVAAGILGGDLTSIAYFSGRSPAFAILGDLIGGYDSPKQVQDFCRNGGGAEALQTVWDKVKPKSIHVVGCGSVSKEALVAKVPIRTVEELKGVKIRSPEGLAAAVFSLAGASPVNIPFSEVFTSLEKGVVDAADASAYVNNDRNGFHQIAKYPIYPGIHSMAVHQFTVGQRTWNKLSDEDKTILTDWYYDAYADLLNALDEEDKKLVQRDQSGSDITVVDWAQEERDKFRTIAKQAWEQTAERSPEARVALDAHYQYMKSKGLL